MGEITLEDIKDMIKVIGDEPTYWTEYEWGSVEYTVVGTPVSIKLNEELHEEILDLFKYQSDVSKLKNEEIGEIYGIKVFKSE